MRARDASTYDEEIPWEAQAMGVIADAPSFGTSTSRRWLLAIVFASLCAKLFVFSVVYSTDPDRFVAGDSASYESPARALVVLGRFAHRPEPDSPPEVRRTPGYPTFIAGHYWLFGEGRAPVILGQIAVSIATMLVMYAISARLWDRWSSVLGVTILCLDPLSFVYSQLVSTETIYTLALVLAAWGGVALLHGGRAAWALLFGTATACAVMIRPIGSFLLAPALAGFIWHGWVTRRDWHRLLAIALLALVPWLLIVDGWRLRNYMVTGSSQISDITGVALLWYRGAGIVAERDGVSFEEAQRIIGNSLPDIRGWTPARIDDLNRREGFRLIREHPFLFLKIQLQGLVRIIAGPGHSDLLHYLGGVPYGDTPSGAVGLSVADIRQKWRVSTPWLLGLTAYSAVYLAVLYASAGYAMLRIRDRQPTFPAHLFVLGMIAYHLVLSAGPEAYARFRVPIMPLLALYAGRGGVYLLAGARSGLPLLARVVGASSARN